MRVTNEKCDGVCGLEGDGERQSKVGTIMGCDRWKVRMGGRAGEMMD